MIIQYIQRSLLREKKKTVTAFCLIAIMLVLWFRVLMDKGPEKTSAAVAENAKQQQGEPKNSLIFIELEKVKGRHDVLERDFFEAGDWSEFSNENDRAHKVETVAAINGDDELIIKRIIKKIHLEAIWNSHEPRAFINDTFVGVNDYVTVNDGSNEIKCQVEGIEKNSVVLKCGNSQIELKLVQGSDFRKK